MMLSPALLRPGAARMQAISLAMLLALAASMSEPVLAQEAATSTPSTTLDQAAMESFLVQSRAAVAGGASAGDLQQVEDAVLWRKHDWAGREDLGNRDGGYQASDSVEQDLPGGRIFVQTFDFGDGGRRFGRFDLGQGDGGQTLAIVKGAAYAIMTEDGGGGVQWFIGEGCRASPSPLAPFASWLFFDANASSEWRERVAHLRIAPRLSACPTTFDPAYTRWRRAQVHFPFRVSGPSQATREGTWAVDSIVSEHYGGDSIATAEHLERFWFGRGYGLLRWERWENADRSSRRNLSDDARSLAASGRCTSVEGSDAPGPAWSMVDCRTWTNFVGLATPWKAADFHWPRPDVVAQIEARFAKK